VFYAVQNTNTLFSGTQPDASITVEARSATTVPKPPVTYAFRSANGKAIIAYWLPVLSKPGVDYGTATITLQISNSGIQNPVLVNVTSGKMTGLSWKSGAEGILENLPLRDSVMAIADRSYFDWPELPEAPSELNAKRTPATIELTWKIHEGNPTYISLERRDGRRAAWHPISRLGGSAISYSDRSGSGNGEPVSYRVRAGNDAGTSAYSNIVTLAQ
jgi:hypothetical protein